MPQLACMQWNRSCWNWHPELVSSTRSPEADAFASGYFTPVEATMDESASMVAPATFTLPQWSFTWFWRELFAVKLFSHFWHLNGLSLVNLFHLWKIAVGKLTMIEDGALFQDIRIDLPNEQSRAISSACLDFRTDMDCNNIYHIFIYTLVRSWTKDTRNWVTCRNVRPQSLQQKGFSPGEKMKSKRFSSLLTPMVHSD